MKKLTASFLCGISILALASCSEKAKLDINLSDKFEGQPVELINFLDSTVVAYADVVGGRAEILPAESTPVFTSVMIDGRTRAFYIVESGVSVVNDSTSTAVGTPLNDKFTRYITTLDSIESTDDIDLYMDFVEKTYNDNKNNPIGSYFGIEWLKYANYNKVDSFLNVAPKDLRDSKKAKYYQKFAELRAATAPGMPFVDFEGETADGKPVAFSSYVKPGSYTLVDFWASWCPYCIKELPELAALHEKWDGKGLQVIGVAVRDTPDDSKAAVKKHNIVWPVIYNTQKKPYDIYGFSGIPHHILVGPDGKIVSRDETFSQIDARLREAQNK